MTESSYSGPIDPIFDTDALAAYMGISAGSIYQRRSKGEPFPPAIRLGNNTLRWRKSAVDAWLLAQTESEVA